MTWPGWLTELAQVSALVALGGIVAAAAAGWAVGRIVVAVLRRVAMRTDTEWDQWIIEHLHRPLVVIATVAGVRLAMPAVPLPEAVHGVVAHTMSLVVIGTVGWLFISATYVLDEYLQVRYLLDVSDNLRARRIHTKFRLMRRALLIVVTVLTGGAMLMTFPAARHLGTGLLASAGMAGLILGIAARPTVEALIAGVQLAITEPINLDDVVIVEGEWGRIEEITATYVVVCIWDLRRLVVPVAYFINQPFQNWTRVTADLLGAVTLDVDYRTPVEAVRQAAGAWLEASDRWDRKFWNLQVIDTGERTMRLRVLCSAPDSGTAWDLRCGLREHLVTWLQEAHPEALPRQRAEVTVTPASSTPRSPYSAG